MKKDKKRQEKNLVVNLLELIHVMQKMVMVQIVRLVMYKHLLMSSKIKELKKLEKQLIKEKKIREKLEKEIKKKVKSTKQRVESRKKIKRQK